MNENYGGMRSTAHGAEETALDPQRFVRIHRSAIVNIDLVVERARSCTATTWRCSEAGRRFVSGDDFVHAFRRDLDIRSDWRLPVGGDSDPPLFKRRVEPVVALDQRLAEVDIPPSATGGSCVRQVSPPYGEKRFNLLMLTCNWRFCRLRLEFERLKEQVDCRRVPRRSRAGGIMHSKRGQG